MLSVLIEHKNQLLGIWTDANDNSTLTYTRWWRNEPNNNGGVEDVLEVTLTDGLSFHYGRNGFWNDQDSKQGQADQADRIDFDDNNSFICVKDL